MRYFVTANTLTYGDFYDSGDAHRYAKSLSKRLAGAASVRVNRVRVIKPALNQTDDPRQEVIYVDGHKVS